MQLDRVFFFLSGDRVDQYIVPSCGDRLKRRTDTPFVSKFDKVPVRNLEERIAAARGGCFGMHDFAVAKKHESTLGFFSQLERAAAPAETTHLQNIDNMKKIGRIRRRALGRLNRSSQAAPPIGPRKTLVAEIFRRWLVGGVIGKNKNWNGG